MSAKGKKKAGRVILIVLIFFIIAAVAADWILSVVIYEQNFGHRFNSYEPMMYYTEDFDGLTREQYRFPSDKGQMLTGYLYKNGEDQRGIIIFAHGFGGGGHNSYMECINYFAQHGYYVFAYDATACDESEGKKVGSLSQGVADLDYAISFVEQSGDFPSLPIGLFGHSWGGYCVSAVLEYHPEVSAVIECAGFNGSPDMFDSVGREQAGNIIDLMLPFVKLHDRINFGKYASATAMDGFAASDTPVMAVHSQDDTTVPIRYGYDRYYEKYSGDPRFTFMHCEDKGHNVLFDMTYYKELNKKEADYINTLDYDRKLPENQDRFEKDMADFYHRELDRGRWCHMIYEDMFEEFVRFYDEKIS